ncbi:MAG: SPOR domain-containing protein [Rikenellaceae bacterium]|nr:SPOR domain-containing protein [Rikenellaceae bacterium]
MSKPVIKLLSLPFALAATLSLLLSPEGAAAQGRKAAKQQAEELSYQQAGTPAAGKKEREWVDPNATIVRGTPRSRLSPAEQMVCNLTERKAELQKQVDLLGAELKTARGSRARKITKELDILADQIAVIDRKLEALPKPQSIPDAYSSGKPFKQFVDSLVDRRIEEEGYVKGPGDTPATDNYVAPTQSAAAAYRIVYRVQLAVTTRPNEAAFSGLAGVKMLQRPDGKYAYYYGGYPNYAEAQAACKRLRADARYRDAFVVAMQGTQRISIQEAARLTVGR